MAQNRCDLCGLFGCRHVKNASANEISIGDSLDDIINEVANANEKVFARDQDGIPIKTKDDAPTEPKIRVVATSKRVIVPPLPKRISVSNQTVGVRTSFDQPITAAAKPNVVTENSKTGFIVCSVCGSNIVIGFINMHMKMHTDEYERKNKTAITIVPKLQQSPATNLNAMVAASKPKQTIKSAEIYRFKKIEAAFAAATVSNNRRYSDFTCVLWFEPKISSWSGSYTGSSSSFSKDQERLSIHIVYDSLEDYYTLTCKMLERSSFGVYDRETASIPDRVCYQEDIMSEIKKMLLFLGISPRAAYKHFRKLFNQDIITEANKEGKIFIAQTKNSIEFAEKLKKSADSTTTSRYGSGSHYDYQGH